MVEKSVVLVTSDNSPVVVKPGDGSLDFPSMPVTLEHSLILRWRVFSSAAMRADEPGSSKMQRLAQRVTVRRFVVDQSLWNGRIDAVLNERFNQLYFSVVRCGDRNAQGKSVAIGKQHDLGSLATLGVADESTPFLAGENVPSAIDASRSSLPFSPRIISNCSHASDQTPRAVHSWNRRQQVAEEGNRFGRSFQRAPERSTQRTPSKQSRAFVRGRPRKVWRGGSSNKCSIRPHCSSVNSYELVTSSTNGLSQAQHVVGVGISDSFQSPIRINMNVCLR